MSRANIPKIIWGDALDKVLQIGHRLDNAVAYGEPEQGSEFVRFPAAIDAWVTGQAYFLEGEVRWIPTESIGNLIHPHYDPTVWDSPGATAVYTLNQADPFGGTLAWKYDDPDTGSFNTTNHIWPEFAQVDGLTVSIYTKQADGTTGEFTFDIRNNNIGEVQGGFDWTFDGAGLLNTFTATGQATSLVSRDVGDGWYHLSAKIPTYTTPDSNTFIRLYKSAGASSTGSVFVYKPLGALGTGTPPAATTGWDVTDGVQDFLEWARDGNVFQWHPDREDDVDYVESVLLEPRAGAPELEDDGRRRLRLRMMSADGQRYEGY